MNRILLSTVFLTLGILIGVAGYWSMGSTRINTSPAISVDYCTARKGDELLTVNYSFKVSPTNDGQPFDMQPFVMVHASVMDDINATSRDMGHHGGLLGGSHKSGKIQERLYILEDLVDPYIILVVTIGNEGEAGYDRRAFVVSIRDGKQGDAAGRPDGRR